MTRILIVECMQEISSFNPLPSGYENFHILRGEEIYLQRDGNQAVAGALSVFESCRDIEVIPTISARSGSAGLLSANGWHKLSTEIMDRIRTEIDQADAVYFSLHGAMGADGELDPEGYLLEQTRALAGKKPIVISLDLHGILTDRMLRQIDGLAIYWTYPHVDFFDTGRRAAELLLRLVNKPVKPTIARVVIPALVRGDELITKNGCYGDLLHECQRLEAEGIALAALATIWCG